MIEYDKLIQLANDCHIRTISDKYGWLVIPNGSSRACERGKIAAAAALTNAIDHLNEIHLANTVPMTSQSAADEVSL